jgi:hypothetical protein
MRAIGRSAATKSSQNPGSGSVVLLDRNAEVRLRCPNLGYVVLRHIDRVESLHPYESGARIGVPTTIMTPLKPAAMKKLAESRGVIVVCPGK